MGNYGKENDDTIIIGILASFSMSLDIGSRAGRTGEEEEEEEEEKEEERLKTAETDRPSEEGAGISESDSRRRAACGMKERRENI